MDTNETPNTVHGRLLEAVHISGYTFERACAELEWLLDEDRWKTIGTGYDDIKAFFSTLNFSELRPSVEARQKLAKRLEHLTSQRETAKLLGVTHPTIGKDLGRRGKKLPPMPTPQDESDGRNGKKLPTAWFQTDLDPARDAKRDQHREAKEQIRESRREDNRRKLTTAADPLIGGAKFATIVIDPPWDWNDEGDGDQLGRARPTYATMSIDDIREHPVDQLADVDCHCYLWITNRSLPKGFDLLEAWGFRYVTCLTWCKPSIGMGNYFRGATEHVLFGVKGSQGLKRKDVKTWFEAPRTGAHSTKPDAFYSLVESCSPSPYIDIFGRQQREGWIVWGADAL